MSYKDAKTLSKLILLVSLIGYIAAAVFINRESELAAPFMYAATTFLVLAVIVRAVWLKCPHCRMRISYKQIKSERCPFCGKPLD